MEIDVNKLSKLPKIRLVESDEVKSGRGGKKSGEKYGKYHEAILENHIVDWIREQIEASIQAGKNGIVRVRTSELAAAIGLEMREDKESEGLSPVALAWGFKCVLYYEGFWVTTGKTKHDEPLLVIRTKKSKDKLPLSLQEKKKSSEEVDKKEEIDKKDEEIKKDEENKKEEEETVKQNEVATTEQ